jgi:hypothetical protein
MSDLIPYIVSISIMSLLLSVPFRSKILYAIALIGFTAIGHWLGK